ncbi:MAG TPA: hypothetical protein VJ063_19465 [Verrucomicrobiae bacterium]|nr:hypothetical protein [Verrucomicrobiae bacterium]
MRAPEVLVLRWIIARSNIVLIRLIRALLDLGEWFMRRERKLILSRALIFLGLGLVTVSGWLAAQTRRWADYWESDL